MLVQVSPSGGTLSGPGISGLYFSPSLAGAGSHSITYSYTDQFGCYELTSKQFEVLENPYVDLGPDKLIDIGETIELTPISNGSSFLWQDGSSENNLTIIARELGIGSFDIWVKVTNLDQCISTDSLVLTISMVDEINDEKAIQKPLVFPNPFYKYFYLKIDENETLLNISIYGINGILYINDIPNTYPYFYLPDIRAGLYILKLKTDKHYYILQIIKN